MTDREPPDEYIEKIEMIEMIDELLGDREAELLEV